MDHQDRQTSHQDTTKICRSRRLTLDTPPRQNHTVESGRPGRDLTTNNKSQTSMLTFQNLPIHEPNPASDAA